MSHVVILLNILAGYRFNTMVVVNGLLGASHIPVKYIHTIKLYIVTAVLQIQNHIIYKFSVHIFL